MIYVRKKRSGLLVPTFINFASSQSGNPTTPAGAVGDTLVSAATRASGTPPTPDGAWSSWSTEAHSGVSMSLAFAWKTATGTASGDDPITWTNASGLRAMWRFRNAAIDTLNFSQGPSSTAINYEAQPSMTAQSLVGLMIVANNAQTNISTALAGAGTTLTNLGFTQRGSRNASIAGWAGDGGINLFDAFDPADSTIDTAAAWIVGAFSIKAAA